MVAVHATPACHTVEKHLLFIVQAEVYYKLLVLHEVVEVEVPVADVLHFALEAVDSLHTHDGVAADLEVFASVSTVQQVKAVENILSTLRTNRVAKSLCKR